MLQFYEMYDFHNQAKKDFNLFAIDSTISKLQS